MSQDEYEDVKKWPKYPMEEKIEILDKSNSKKSRETIEIVSLLFEGKVTVIYSN